MLPPFPDRRPRGLLSALDEARFIRLTSSKHSAISMAGGKTVPTTRRSPYGQLGLWRGWC